MDDGPHGKVVCILGVSHGIGLCYSKFLLAANIKTLILINKQRPVQAISELTTFCQGFRVPRTTTILHKTHDGEDAESTRQALAKVTAKSGKIHILIVNQLYNQQLKSVPFTDGVTRQLVKQFGDFAVGNSVVLHVSGDPRHINPPGMDRHLVGEVYPAFASATDTFIHQLRMEKPSVKVIIVHLPDAERHSELFPSRAKCSGLWRVLKANCTMSRDSIG
jgi:NAD(P)-dependent dehydrogenase (short-subunit alcohol dehydrogenase family)